LNFILFLCYTHKLIFYSVPKIIQISRGDQNEVTTAAGFVSTPMNFRNLMKRAAESESRTSSPSLSTGSDPSHSSSPSTNDVPHTSENTTYMANNTSDSALLPRSSNGSSGSANKKNSLTFLQVKELLDKREEELKVLRKLLEEKKMKGHTSV
jgi:hypothetical protein